MYRKNREELFFYCTMFMLTLSMMLSPNISLGKENKLTDPLIEHLEFLGYQCDLVAKGIRAQHHSKIHLYITYFQGGIRLQTGFPGKKKEASGLAKYEVLNTLNKANQVARFYWSATGNLFGIAWMPGSYDRSRFSTFLEAWEHDTENLRNAYEHVKPYLDESVAKTNAES